MLERNHLPGNDLFVSAISQMEQMSTAGEEEIILSFAGGHAKLKDALLRAADINKSIGTPQLLALDRAQIAMTQQWPFLAAEPSTAEDDRLLAEELDDLLHKETFFKELPRIDQCASRIRKLYKQAFDKAVSGRAAKYTAAVAQLKSIHGCDQVDEEQQQRIAEPLTSRTSTEVRDTTPIPQLLSDIDACDKRLSDAIAQLYRLLEGDRIVRLKVVSHFSGGIDTEEQLDTALCSLRDECLHHIAKNKRILIE